MYMYLYTIIAPCRQLHLHCNIIAPSSYESKSERCVVVLRLSSSPSVPAVLVLLMARHPPDWSSNSLWALTPVALSGSVSVTPAMPAPSSLQLQYYPATSATCPAAAPLCLGLVPSLPSMGGPSCWIGWRLQSSPSTTTKLLTFQVRIYSTCKRTSSATASRFLSYTCTRT